MKQVIGFAVTTIALALLIGNSTSYAQHLNSAADRTIATVGAHTSVLSANHEGDIQPQTAAAKDAERFAQRFEDLSHGKMISFATPLASSIKTTVLEQHTVNVDVHYDARPIGGILNIRVSVVPVFSGIGSASRPIAVREVAEAVDNLDEATVTQIVDRLTTELGKEYATR